MVKRTLLVLTSLWIACNGQTGPLCAQCRPGGCGAPAAQPEYKWTISANDRTWHLLWKGDRQVGAWNELTDVYRELRRDGTWGPEEKGKWACNCACPRCTCQDSCKCKKNGEKCNPECSCTGKHFFFGVQAEKIHRDRPRHYINGKEVERHEVLNALRLADDSKKPYVTFIGEGRDKPLAQFLQTPEAQKCRIQSYPSDAWEVSRVGFKVDGKPTIYIQNPCGEVLCRFDADPGPDKLVQEVRKAQPDYDPSRDPNGQGFGINLNSLKNIPASVWTLGGLGLLLLLQRKKAS
jgi:hypothetical protein